VDARLAPGDRPTALSAFRSRDFRLLWGGQTVSYIGDTAFLVALGWRVTSLTGSVGSLGFVLSLNAAAMLTTLLWGGVLWATSVTMLGYFLGNVDFIANNIELLLLAGVAVSVVPIGFQLLRHQRRPAPPSRRHRAIPRTPLPHRHPHHPESRRDAHAPRTPRHHAR